MLGIDLPLRLHITALGVRKWPILKTTSSARSKSMNSASRKSLESAHLRLTCSANGSAPNSSRPSSPARRPRAGTRRKAMEMDMEFFIREIKPQSDLLMPGIRIRWTRAFDYIEGAADTGRVLPRGNRQRHAGGSRESGFNEITASRRAEAFRMHSGGWEAQLRNIEAFRCRATVIPPAAQDRAAGERLRCARRPTRLSLVSKTHRRQAAIDRLAHCRFQVSRDRRSPSTWPSSRTWGLVSRSQGRSREPVRTGSRRRSHPCRNTWRTIAAQWDRALQDFKSFVERGD